MAKLEGDIEWWSGKDREVADIIYHMSKRYARGYLEEKFRVLWPLICEFIFAAVLSSGIWPRVAGNWSLMFKENVVVPFLMVEIFKWLPRR